MTSLRNTALYARLTKDEKKVKEDQVIAVIESQEKEARTKTHVLEQEIRDLDYAITNAKDNITDSAKSYAKAVANSTSISSMISLKKDAVADKVRLEKVLASLEEAIELKKLELEYVKDAKAILFAETAPVVVTE